MITYKLEPIVSKIVSPVAFILPDGERKEYSSGTEACEDKFDHKYVVERIQALEGSIEIELSEVDSLNGDETFF